MKGLIVVLVTILFVSVQYANAEPLTITANNGEMDMSIIIDDDYNTVKIQTEKSLFQYWDSYVKYFKSGAFKVSSKYLLLFVSPISDGQYKIAYITSDGIQRFTGNKVTEIYDEPKSSVGADITKYDIPNVGRSEHKITPYSKQHNPDSLDMVFSVPDRIEYKHDFKFDVIAIDTQIKPKSDQKLSNVTVTTFILNPIGEIIGNWNGTTNISGFFGGVWYVPDNQMLGEYKVKVSMEKENYTPILKMVSFFVQPLEDSNSSKCPYNFTLNSTTGVCE